MGRVLQITLRGFGGDRQHLDRSLKADGQPTQLLRGLCVSSLLFSSQPYCKGAAGRSTQDPLPLPDAPYLCLSPPPSLLTHSLHLSEASRMGEVVEPVQTKQEEEEAFLKEILAVQHQLSTHRERHGAAAQPCPPRAALGSAGGDTEQVQSRAARGEGAGKAVLSLPPPLCTQGPPHKGALQPQEEPPGLRGDLRQAPISGGSVKKQLRLEQERSLELRLQNLQLQQENIKVRGGDVSGQGRGFRCMSLSVAARESEGS